jgi:hypothetical protein
VEELFLCAIALRQVVNIVHHETRS